MASGFPIAATNPTISLTLSNTQLHPKTAFTALSYAFPLNRSKIHKPNSNFPVRFFVVIYSEKGSCSSPQNSLTTKKLHLR
jgi:hypothetical protein